MWGDENVATENPQGDAADSSTLSRTTLYGVQDALLK